MFGDQHGEKDVTGTGGGGIWCGESSSPFLLSKMSAPHACLGADGSLCEPLAMPALPCLAPGLAEEAQELFLWQQCPAMGIPLGCGDFSRAKDHGPEATRSPPEPRAPQEAQHEVSTVAGWDTAGR